MLKLYRFYIFFKDKNYGTCNMIFDKKKRAGNPALFDF